MFVTTLMFQMFHSMNSRFQLQCRSISVVLTRSFTVLNHFNVENQIKSFNDQKNYLAALTLFDRYKNEQRPTDRMIVQALKACTKLKNVERGRSIHEKLPPATLLNEFIQSTLINFYIECNELNNAENIFNLSKIKTTGVYASMMKGYLQNKKLEKVIELFSKIEQPNAVCFNLVFTSCARLATKDALKIGQNIFSKLPKIYFKNEFIMTSLLDMFIKCDDRNNAEKIFNEMIPNVVDYGQMMKYFNQKEMPMKTLKLYEKMQRTGVNADSIIYVLVIEACSQIGIQSKCQSIVEKLPPLIKKNIHCQTSLIDMWGKAGLISEAKNVFNTIVEPNIHAYTAMIHVYGLNGLGSEAVALFHRIPKELIVDHTYVSVLNACSHSKLVNEARSIFSKIEKKQKRIYTAMVDCLSRSFFFDEAQRLIEEFEKDHPPYIIMYTSLLSGVRNARNPSLSEQVTHRMRTLFPTLKDDLIAADILHANTLASSGEMDKALSLRWKLNQTGSKKEAGLSWTEAHGEVVQFRAHDRSHPKSNEIYAEIDRIRDELIQHGHQFDSSWISRPMMPDETVESVLNGHSERLALAFNFIQTPIPSTIQIIKNLRICGDCHSAIKLISRFRQCSIVIRDARRIHHFVDGNCSCNDDY